MRRVRRPVLATARSSAMSCANGTMAIMKVNHGRDSHARSGWDLWRDGCPGGERPGQVGARVDRLLALVAGDKHVLIFAHGHVLRVIAARWLQLEPGAGALFALGAGAVSVPALDLRGDQDRRAKVTRASGGGVSRVGSCWCDPPRLTRTRGFEIPAGPTAATSPRKGRGATRSRAWPGPGERGG